MYKTLLTSAFLCLLFCSATAQNALPSSISGSMPSASGQPSYSSSGKEDKKVVEATSEGVLFGLKAGLNYGQMNFNRGFPKPSPAIESRWKTGYHVGFLMEIPLLYSFFLQQEYLFSEVRGGPKHEDVLYTHSYLSLPLLLKYKASPAVTFMVGPLAELLISAKENNKGTSLVTTHETEERSIGAIAGMEAQLANNFKVSGRYIYGFNHVGLTQRSASKEFKYEIIQLSFVYMLPALKKAQE